MPSFFSEKIAPTELELTYLRTSCYVSESSRDSIGVALTRGQFLDIQPHLEVATFLLSIYYMV